LLALAVPGRRAARPVVAEAASPVGREPELALDLSAS
jgi:hypothetical protein